MLAAAAAMFGDHPFGDAPISVFLTHPEESEAPRFAINSSFLSSPPTFQGVLASLSALSAAQISPPNSLLDRTPLGRSGSLRRILISFILCCCWNYLLHLEQFDRSVSERLRQTPSPFLDLLENLKHLPMHRCSPFQAALASAVSNFISATVAEVA